jgi:hypothetical protein
MTPRGNRRGSRAVCRVREVSMGFADAVRRGIEIAKLDRGTYREVAADPHAFTPALVIAALAGTALWLGHFTFHVGGFLGTPLLELALLFIGSAVFHFIAILFSGRGDYLTLVRVWGTGWLVGWLMVIPILGPILALWRIVVAVVAVEEIYGIDRTRAIITVLIPVAAVALIALIGTVTLALLGGLRSWFWLV